MAPKRWFILFGVAFAALGQMGRSQGASSWRGFRVADGLPESACRSISVSAAGDVLTLSLDSFHIAELDGYGVKSIPAPSGAVGRIGAGPDGRLWAMTAQGLAEWKDGAWVSHPVEAITAQCRTNESARTSGIPFGVMHRGRVIFLLPDRLMELDLEDAAHPRTLTLRAANRSGLERFYGLAAARDGGLWICGAGGLARIPGPGRNLKPAAEWQVYRLPVLLGVRDLQEPAEDDLGGVTTVGETRDGRRRVVVYFDGEHWRTRSAGGEPIRRAWRGPAQVFWADTRETLFQFPSSGAPPVQNRDLDARRYYDAAVAPDGTFWLATSDGLFRYTPPVWRSPDPLKHITDLVHDLAVDSENRLWFVSGNGLRMFHEGTLREFALPGASARSLETALALYALTNGTLLLDTGEGCLQFHPARAQFMPVTAGTPGRRFRSLGQLRDGSVCLVDFASDASAPQKRLSVFNGVRLLPARFPYPPLSGELITLFAAQNGDLWVSGADGIARFRNREWRVFASTGGAPARADVFAELDDGKILCATPATLWEYDGQQWSSLRSGFDHVNAILPARDGSVWVASDTGLFRFWKDAWLENGTEEGLSSSSIRGLIEDRRGHLWAATSRGLSLRHPGADPDPPRAAIRRLGSANRELFAGGTVDLFFSGLDKWKCTRRDRLLYSYRLDQHNWSAFEAQYTVSLTDLPAGKHFFQLRCMDRNGNVDPVPAQLEFTVVLPWYRETRLVVIGSAGLAAALFFAGLAFNRHRQLLLSYAAVEKKVAERTRELEQANRELLHSQKMNALGTLAAGIAHDFNNILSIVKGSAQIIEDNLANAAKVRTRVDRIKTVVEQGSGIVKAMLGFSRESDAQPGWLDPNVAVEDTVRLLGDRFLREVEIRMDRAPDLPAVQASRDFIQQILLNFILNAAESMAGRKQVILSTRRAAGLPDGIVLMPVAAPVYVWISVQDFGCGIPPEALTRIFEPFFTTKAFSRRRGTGLGLSMAYELARKLEAGLAVASAVQHGSTFILILPVRGEPPGPPASGAGPSTASPSNL